MKKEEIKYFCDICKKETNKKDFFQVNYPVIFDTKQTDDIGIKSYIKQKEIDMCIYCADKVLKITASDEDNPIYEIRDEDPKWQKLKEFLNEDKLFDLFKEEFVDGYKNCLLSIKNKMQELEAKDE